MKIFNFFELFFIISLAIMFILVGMLMYQIRGQINEADKRTDSLFEIVANLSNELNAQKVHMANFRYSAAGGLTPTLIPFQPPRKILVSDDGSECAAEGQDDDETSYLEDVAISADDVVENTIHVIKFPLYKDPDEIELIVENIDCGDVTDAVEQETDATENNSEKSLDLERHGMEESHAPAHGGAEHEDLNKMNLAALRKLATDRGMSSHDVAKMKKAELIAELSAGTSA
jgi:hypothetical protein